MAAENNIQTFANLDALAGHLRRQIEQTNKKVTLIFAHNGTGKTRLSMAFKELGKTYDEEGQTTARDTLYFNAFTEDLFSWDNDLENDRERVLRMNLDSAFFDGLAELEMENRIRPLLHRYCDFDFSVDYDNGAISFYRDERVPQEDGTYETKRHDNIKISRGEENVFIWCFFLAIAELAIDGQEAYDWVKYLYIDDPISSLDENNAIAVAAHLAQMLKDQNRIKAVISSHHTLFFNVLCNEMKKAQRFYLSVDGVRYQLQDTGDTPNFYHVSMLQELRAAAQSGRLYTYHFNILRSILEKAASFHGFSGLKIFIKEISDSDDDELLKRYLELLSHGSYSLFEWKEMAPDNKEKFKTILTNFMNNYRFDPKLFP